MIFLSENIFFSKLKVDRTEKRPLTWKKQKRDIVINNSATLIMSALGLVAALSWNDAIKSSITTLFPSESDLIYKFYVAIVVTVLSVIITYLFSKVKPK